MKKEFLSKRVVFPMVGIVSLLLTTPLWGEEKQVMLPDAISAAMKNYGELKIHREERRISEAAAVKAGLYPNPVLELGGTTGALTGSSSENSITLGISQEFLTGSKREKRMQVAEKELAGFDNRLKDAERLLRLEVKTIYYDLLLADGRHGLAQKAEELNGQLLRISGERLAAGEVAELDLNLAKVEAGRAEGRKFEAELAKAPLQQRLSVLMGSSSGEQFVVKGSLDMGVVSNDLVELKKQAAKNRPDLMAYKMETEKAEAELLLAGAEKLPNVTLGLAYSREKSLTSLGGIEEKNTDNLIGLKISVPLQIFDHNQAGQQQASARKNSAITRYIFAQQSVERDVETSYTRFNSAQKAVVLYRTGIIPQLEENLKLVQEAYKLGEVGIMAVIEEQKKFIEVNDNYLTALYNWNSAAAKLEVAVGVEFKNEDGGNK